MAREESAAPSGMKQACLIVGSFLMQVVVLGIFYSYGTLFAALKAGTGDSASTLALVGSMRDFVFGLSNAPAGFLVHRVGFVRMSAIGACMLLVGLLADSFAPSSSFLFLSCSLVGGVSMAMLFSPAATVLYGRTGRSFLPVAVGLASSGAGLGTVVVNWSLDTLLDTFSWRGALRVCCSAFCPLLLVAVAALWWGLRQGRHEESGSTAEYQELKSKSSFRDFLQPFKDVQFVLLNVALLLYCVGFMVPYTHLVYYAERERGLQIAAELTSLLGGAGVAARLCFGLCSAFMRPSRLLLVMFVVQGASLMWLPFCTEAVELKVFSAIYGFSSGGRVVLLSLVLHELFDPDRVSHLYGLTCLPVAVGTLVGPTLVGTLYDFSGSYDAAFFAAGAIVLLAAPVFSLVICRCRAAAQPAALEAKAASSQKAEDLEQGQPPSDLAAPPSMKCSL